MVRVRNSFAQLFIVLALLVAGFSLVSMVTGCAIGAPGGTKPLALKDQLAAADLSLAGFVRTHTSLIQTGRIGKTLDDDLSRQEDDARTALDMAKFYLNLGEVAKAQDQYEALNTLLTAISARISELETQQTGAKP
jgi:ribonuclease PH